jgi:N-acetylneuraminate synthase/sialic acid synthase
MRELNLKNSKITQDSKCYLIAEIGHNHQGSLDQCIKMFKVAKECGADAVKIQKRENKKLYTKSFYNSPYASQNSYADTYGEHREILEFGKDEYQELIKVAKDLKIDFFSTAFDEYSLDFLVNLGIKTIKVASADLKNHYLLSKIAETKIPFIISTGGSALEDVEEAKNLLIKYHENFAVLQCTSGYPAKFEELNLNVIIKFQELFSKQIIGLSSHDNGIAMAVGAYSIGARIIEKHFTLDRTLKGTDHAFSLEPQGLKKLRRDLDRISVALGDGIKRVYDSEIEPIKKMSKMIVAKHFIPKGTVLSIDMISLKSPCEGLGADKIDTILGKKTIVDLNEDDPISPSNSS